jgi:succinate-semialdehyde dehydrogenase/glutarate-semialdehyde dehydrogenase
MSLISMNPATEEVLAEIPELTPTQIEERLELAQHAFLSWKDRPLTERAALLRTLARHFREQAPAYGQTITLEMGKPLKQAIAEVEKCALVCDYYADHGAEILAQEIVKTEAAESFVRFDPLGVILAVMPWNFPFWQVLRFAAPAVMAGNVGLLKHASNVPQCAQAIEAAFAAAGFPKGVFQNLAVGSAKVEGIINHPVVKAVTLTGSEFAGSQVARQAGKAIKKTVLELGGSDPFIVLADADVEAAATVACTARLQNAGQSCIAAKRFIVVASVADRFVASFKKAFEGMVLGDPLQAATTVGPVATKKIRDELHVQVEKSIKLGAKAIIGGKQRAGKGFFYEPTILVDVKKGMPAYDQETFGPVAAVIVVADEEEAIAVANDTNLGLGSSLWTKDLAKAKFLASRINAGCVFINAMVKSDPRLPFGGINTSGYGRELSHYGLKEFVNIKTVWIA